MTKKPSSEALTRAQRVLRMGGALLKMSQRMEEARERAARQQSLHPTDFSCIGYLHRENRPVSPKEIGPYLHLSSGSITALLDRLEKAGYIRRISNPDDRRSVLVELDKDAAREAIALYLRLENSYRLVTESFSDSELDVISDFLEKVGNLPTRVDLARSDEAAKAD